MTDATSSPTTPATGASTPRPTQSGQTSTSTSDPVQPAVVDGVDVDAVARAVRACAGVSDLYAGRFGEIGSYLPGRRIGGVQVSDDAVIVQIRTRWGYTTQDLFTQVAGVTGPLRGGRALQLVVADIDDTAGSASAISSTPGRTPIAVGRPAALESASAASPPPESSSS